MFAAPALRALKFVLLLALALVLGMAVASHRRARARRAATAAPVVVRKSAWAASRPKTVRPVPPGAPPKP